VHREDAFAAAEFIMDYLKNQAPFWKKEITESGDSWVETKDKDKKLFERWGEK
jgi:molybdopterin synthase catalytic subunit